MKKKELKYLGLDALRFSPASKYTAKIKHQLTAFAVLLVPRRIEYWIYEPAILTKAQRKKLGVIGWKKFTIKVKEGDRG